MKPTLGLLVLALGVLVVTPAMAQQAVVVSGTVTDSSGGVLPGATVEALRGNRITATTTTGSNGRYQLELPSAGDIRLTAQIEGFATGTINVSPAAGATQDFRLGLAPVNDTVVVTASRTEESRASVTESLSVFTAEDIQALGSHSLADVVTTIPGLNIETTGREGSGSSLFSRGGEGDYNHVMIDGVRVNTSGGAFNFSRVSASEIERVEVVRGAQSALYGSDAIGSVVQIFTKRGTPTAAPRVYGSFESGTFDTVRSDLRMLGGAQQRIDYQFGAAYRGTNGAFEDRLPDPDRFDQTSYDASFGAIVGDQVRLRAAGRYSNARGRAIGPIGYAPGDDGTLADTEDYSGHVTFNQSVNTWFNHSAVVTYFRNDRQSNDEIADPSFTVFALMSGTPGALFPEGPRVDRLLDESEFSALATNPAGLAGGQFLSSALRSDFPFTFAEEFRRNSFEYRANVTWAGDQVLSTGYEYEREEDPLRERDATSAGFRIEDHSFFAQQQFVFADQWFATAGVRVNDNSRFGTEASPKLSVGGYPIAITDGTVSSVKVFANIGLGIKSPDFSQLFGSAFVDGDPNLQPERATTIDVGAEVTFDAQRWLGRVTYFDNDFEDQIAFQFSPGFNGDGIPDFLNIEGSQAHGLELDGGLQRPIAGVTAMASYAYVDSGVVNTINTSDQFRPGQPLIRRPKHSGSLRVNYTRGRGSAHLNLRFSGDRHDSAFFNLTRLSDGVSVPITFNPGYTLVGLGGQYRVHDELTIYLQIENVTDKEYDSAFGYPGLPRAFVLGGRFNFGQ